MSLRAKVWPTCVRALVWPDPAGQLVKCIGRVHDGLRARASKLANVSGTVGFYVGF